MNQIAHPTPPIRSKRTFDSIQTIFVVNASGDPASEDHPNEVPTTPTVRETIFMKPYPHFRPPNAASTPALETCANNQSTSAANMVIPSKEIASAVPIVSPGIVCWNATGCAFQDPYHIRSSVCQIDNLAPSSKSFVRK
uniref:Uncharacterized protein n=1 Tax=Romanomermis culicivorax TaxID=13658 RepID=A0A915L6Q1_ROMCU